MVDSELLVDGGDEVGDLHGMILDEHAFFVGFTQHTASRDSTAGDGHGECIRPVVASTHAVNLRRAAEFACENHKGGIEHATLIQLFDK